MENLNGFKHLTHFFGVCCRKIIPLIYDDSLSYYEMLCRLTRKINDVIDTINGLIDADIEGYLKNLIDEYATAEVTSLINEIGETMLNEIAERVIAEQLDGWIDRLENVEQIVPAVETSGEKRITANREHYIWCGNPSIASDYQTPGGHVLNKADLVLVDNDYYFYFINYNGETEKLFRIVKVARGDYSEIFSPFYSKETYGSGHGTIYNEYLVTVSAGNTLAFFNKQTSETNPAPGIAFTVAPDAANPIIGRIAYDAVTGKLYACGRMQDDTNYDVYEVTLHMEGAINTWYYTTTMLFTYSPSTIMSIPQNMCAYDGMLYVGASNPNIIICVDLTLEKVVNIVYFNNRLDDIIPFAELQGISTDGTKLFVSSYNSKCVSGIRYLNAVGSCKLDGTVYPNITNIFRNVDDTNRYMPTLYVDRYPSQTSTSSAHHYVYDRYKNACGWYGTYDYLPFYNLWEAVECAVGLLGKTGMKSAIALTRSVADPSNDGALQWGETSIPTFAVETITGYHPDREEENVAVHFLDFYGGGHTNVYRVIFTGNRGTVGFSHYAFVHVDGSKVILSACALGYVPNNPIKDNTDISSFIRVDGGGEFYSGTFADPLTFGLGGGDWLGTTMTQHAPNANLVYVNAGIANYRVAGNADYYNLEKDGGTRLALVNFTEIWTPT